MILVAASCLYWLINGLVIGLTRFSLRQLGEIHPAEPAAYPLLSLIIPACNEADTVEAAVVTRLADDYPNLEVVIIDDRSTDPTGEIIDRIAARDSRVRALHVTELPAGWLGKLNALQRGQEASRGEWLLFTDADVHFEPGTLRRAVAFAEERHLDHLAVFPRLISRSFWLSVVLSTVGRTILVFSRVWAVEDPRSSAFIGIGAFNLVKRSSWAKTGGFEWLRLEPADDLGVGLLMKRAGLRTGVLGGRTLVSVEWYPSVRAMAVGGERASFSSCRYSLGLTLAVAAVSATLELGFLCALSPEVTPVVHALGALTAVVALASSVGINSWAGLSWLPALLFPIGVAIQTAALIRAGILGARRGGIIWRGTLYPTAVLRAGRRVKIIG